MLFWLLSIPVFAALLVGAGIVRRRALRRFGEKSVIRQLMPDVSMMRVRIKSALFLLAVTFVVLAMARPQFGSRLSEQKAEGVEMMLVVDVSNSMLAEDLTPSRIERARYAIDKLFASLDQDRVGLVVFAGDAKVQLPITSDYRMARSFARKLSTDLVDVQGTDLGKAMELATMSFSQNTETSKVMIIVSDGEDHDNGALDAARRAAEQGVVIFAVGIGTPEGVPISIGGQMLKDEKGEMVVTKLNEELLQGVTEAGNGGYIRATSASFGLEDIADRISEMKRSELSTLRFEEYNEYFYWMLAVALVLLVVESLLLSHSNPRLRKYNIFRVR